MESLVRQVRAVSQLLLADTSLDWIDLHNLK